jgi:hypothetical protein
MAWSPPAAWVETESQLKKSGSVTLNAAGYGTLTFDPDNARQRWAVAQITVKTNQAATATLVPIAQIAINTADITVLSPGNYFGASWSGNQDTFSGEMDVGPCDFLTVAFSPPPGQSGAALSGVIAYATVTGSKFTRRA